MGNFTFTWPHPAKEVWVTGSFDNWSGNTHQLDKIGDTFEKNVDLSTNDKILYKFVVDGQWIYNHTAQTETDHEGNINNVLYQHDIIPSASDPHHSTISTVGPGATTLAMAGQQPLADTPGAFPETPAAADDKTFSVNPIPASGGIGNPVQLAPGDAVPAASTINDNTLTSSVRDDPELKSQDQTFGVAPIPATGGIGNPVTLAPGEKVPDASQLTGNTIDSNVKLDKASYDKPDAGAAVVAPAGVAHTEPSASSAILSGPGPQTTNIIPESGLPMGAAAPTVDSQDLGPNISSVGPTSTTTQLAGQVPLEPRGTAEVVSDNQNSKDSGFAAKAAAGAAAVGVGAAGAAVAANELLKDKAGVDAKSKLPESVQNKIDNAAQGATTTSAVGDTAPAVPAEVTESQKEASQPPEAAANPEAVQDKSVVEKQLLSEVKTTEAKGEPAPTAAAAAATTAPAATPVLVSSTVGDTPSGVPNIAAAAAAGPTPPAPKEASTDLPAGPSPPQVSVTGAPQIGHPTGGGLAPISMDDKGALNADKDSPADTRAGRLAAQNQASGSRDVSPMSKPGAAGQSQPTVTTGVASGTAPTQSTPKHKKRASIAERFKSTPESSKPPGTPDSKKEKRRSFLGRIKDKLKA